MQEAGLAALQRLAVARLTTERYSVTHALLATIPHDSIITTNSDTCYDAACAAAGIEVVTLPYETRVPGSDAPGRWLLKLHGDVHHPEDIILTYSSSLPYSTELSGVVQALLITKHMLFVGFSLTDDAFNQIAATVRRVAAAAAARRRVAAARRWWRAGGVQQWRRRRRRQQWRRRRERHERPRGRLWLGAHPFRSPLYGGALAGD